MCWSFEISVLTAVVCYAIAFYLIRRNVRWDRANAVWTLAVSSIQIADAFLWYDGMEEGTCKNTNWAISFLVIPQLLKLHCIVRQAEVKFRAFPKTIAIIAVIGVLSHLFLPASMGPMESLYRLNTRKCSSPSALEFGSPVWGSREPPLFHFVVYCYLIAFPLYFSQRYFELVLGLGVLAATFTFKEAFGSKWCSIACSITFYYLFHSGPQVLPNQPKATYMADNNLLTQSEVVVDNDSFDVEVVKPPKQQRSLLDAYTHFLYGTAKMSPYEGEF